LISLDKYLWDVKQFIDFKGGGKIPSLKPIILKGFGK
jgi:hypothetical protein